jgi:hypothetical protein
MNDSYRVTSLDSIGNLDSLFSVEMIAETEFSDFSSLILYEISLTVLSVPTAYIVCRFGALQTQLKFVPLLSKKYSGFWLFLMFQT